MSESRAPLQSNRALELVRTAKSWLIDLIEKTNNPSPSMLGSITSYLPFAGFIPYLNSTNKNVHPNHKQSISYYISQLRKSFNRQNEIDENCYLANLKEILGNS